MRAGTAPGFSAPRTGPVFEKDGRSDPEPGRNEELRGGRRASAPSPPQFPQPTMVSPLRAQIAEELEFLDVPSLQQSPLHALDKASRREVGEQRLQPRLSLGTFRVIAPRRREEP